MSAAAPTNTSSTNGRKFEFVAYSSRAKSKRCSTTVRKHVMHDYFAKQEMLDQSASDSASPGRKRRKPRGRAAAGKKSFAQLDWSNQQPTFEIINQAESVNGTTSSTMTSPRSQPGTLTRLQSYQARCKSPVGRSPGPYRLDPFNILSVKDIPNDLIYWHFALHTCYRSKAPWIYFTNLDWIQRVWRNAIADESLLYVLLSQAERSRVAVTHSNDWTRYLYYKGRALSALRTRIAAEQDNASDSLILLVTSQISHSLTEGDIDAAHTHMQAATELLARRGRDLDGFVLWHFAKMDAKHAAVNLIRPALTLDETFLPLEPPPDLRKLIEAQALASKRTLPPDFPTHVEVLQGLHAMTLAFRARDSSSPETNYFLLSHAQTLHRLSIMAADACDTLNLVPFSSTRRRISHHSAALILCLEFVAWEHCPIQFPWVDRPSFMRRLGAKLLPNLRLFLLPGSEGLVERWRAGGASLVSLVWCLFIGTVMTCIVAVDPGGGSVSAAASGSSVSAAASGSSVSAAASGSGSRSGNGRGNNNGKNKNDSTSPKQEQNHKSYPKTKTKTRTKQDRDPCLPFLKSMTAVLAEMDISDAQRFDQVLKQFPWTDDFCGLWSGWIGMRLGLDGVVYETNDIPGDDDDDDDGEEGLLAPPPFRVNSCCHGECERHRVEFQLDRLRLD